MHFRKRLIAVAAVVAMTAALLYGGTFEPGEVKDPLPSLFGQKETIYFWYSDETMEDFVNNAAVTFGEREDVHVIPVLTSDSQYLEAINQASLHSEQVPDVYMISHDSLEKAYLAGLAEEIEDVADVCNEEHFPEAALWSVTYHGKRVAYPLFYETSILVYNETYLAEWAAQSAMKELLGDGTVDGVPDEGSMGIETDEEALSRLTEEYFLRSIPATVDDLLEIADTFDLPEGVDGVMKWDVSDIFYNYWFAGQYMVVGGEAGDDNTIVEIANQETIQALEVYKNLNQFFYIESDTVTYDSVIQDFLDGKLVFTIATTDIVNRLAKAKEDGTFAFDYGVAPMPDVSPELGSRALSVTNTIAINGYSTHKELANRFAAYLVDEYAGFLYERTGKVSANLNVNTDNGALQILMQEYTESAPLPKMMETGNYWLYLERLFARVWNGEDITALVQELDSQISFQLGADTISQ